mmetsp:Transcript_36969/g.86344  ORF Transcript_36969/g.86344 Transcript_36969/m.86344 type:complete len:215 (-) Transcript_36969:836-1480(-)
MGARNAVLLERTLHGRHQRPPSCHPRVEHQPLQRAPHIRRSARAHLADEREEFGELPSRRLGRQLQLEARGGSGLRPCRHLLLAPRLRRAVPVVMSTTREARAVRATVGARAARVRGLLIERCVGHHRQPRGAVCCVGFGCKQREPVAMEIHSERFGGGDDRIEAERELMASDEVGRADVLLHHRGAQRRGRAGATELDHLLRSEQLDTFTPML